VTTQALAEATGLSVSNLEQVLKQLKDHQIVKSTKGPGGGYKIAADLGELSVLDLVKIFDKSSSSAKQSAAKILPSIDSKEQAIVIESSPEIDMNPIEASFIELMEEFLAQQKIIDLVCALPQWGHQVSSVPAIGRFKLKEPPPKLIPKSPNSVFQLSSFLGFAA
jgi:Rrf2 family protein